MRLDETLSVHMTDIVLGVFVLASAWLSYSRGFVREVFSIASWTVATFAALYGHKYFLPYWQGVFQSSLVASIITFLVLFVVFLTMGLLATHRASKRLQNTSVNAFDRSFGFAFGFLRGVALACIGFLLMLTVRDERPLPGWLQHARTLPILQEGAQKMVQLLPRQMQHRAEQRSNIDDLPIASNLPPDKRRRYYYNDNDDAPSRPDSRLPPPKENRSNANYKNHEYGSRERENMNQLIERLE